MKILVVEDDLISCLALSASLRALGHEVATAENGLQAIALIHEQGIRVVVSDWKMPILDGLELCRTIRTNGGEYVYFMLLSVAESTDENYASALQAGADDFLSKPVAQRELVGRLHVAERILHFTSQVRQLESFLPICVHCHRVRHDQNYWQRIEAYLGERTGTEFSHSVCPDCYEKITVPEFQRSGIKPPPAATLVNKSKG